MRAELAGGAGGGDGERELAVEAGGGDRVGVAAVGQQPDAAAGDEAGTRLSRPLASSTGLTWCWSSRLVMWPMTAMCASLARAGAVRVRIASGRPSQAERSVGDSVEMSRRGGFEDAGELGLDDQQPAVA